MRLRRKLTWMRTARPCRAQCFSHFALYLKGREELVVTIYHGPLSPCHQPPIARVGSIGGAANNALPPASPASHEGDENAEVCSAAVPWGFAAHMRCCRQL